MKKRVQYFAISKWLVAIPAIAFSLAAFSGTVVVTPGSLAGYTYFPKAQVSGSGAGGGGGENVTTLQRCLYAPESPDKTVTVANDMFDYDKDLSFYYRMVGGNGGAGFNGGGGGSSAILLNGAKVAVAPGGNGGSVAAEVAGFVKIKKGDTLRFITGGGGGDGYGSPAVGGGGGAGYTGGGGGASKASGSISAGEAALAVGRGGGDTPGVGGAVAGGFAGTSGSGMTGGVSTYPSGSSSPVGTAGGINSWYYHEIYGAPWVTSTLRHPATATIMGSPNGGMNYGFFSGGGGSLGNGGSHAFNVQPSYCNGSSVNVHTTDDHTYVNDNGPCYTYYNWYNYKRARSMFFPPHTSDMKLTRAYPTVTNNGYNPQNSVAGSFPGQIIGMYQAPVCGILR